MQLNVPSNDLVLRIVKMDVNMLGAIACYIVIREHDEGLIICEDGDRGEIVLKISPEPYEPNSLDSRE